MFRQYSKKWSTRDLDIRIYVVSRYQRCQILLFPSSLPYCCCHFFFLLVIFIFSSSFTSLRHVYAVIATPLSHSYFLIFIHFPLSLLLCCCHFYFLSVIFIFSSFTSLRHFHFDVTSTSSPSDQVHTNAGQASPPEGFLT